jgi:peptidoglycan hydrolase-like protein with peptidoglycan-binding domain
METLSYLHLALAHEAPIDPDYTALASSWENLKQFSRGAINQLWNQPKLSTRAAVSLLSISIALGILGMANQASAAVQEGDRGAEVTSVQQRLQELGYFKANITGFFGPLTKQAVIQFQQAQGLEPDGIVGTSTLTALGGQSQSNSKPARVQSSKTLSSPKSAREASRRFLQLGDRGSEVTALQDSLEAAGFPGGANGIFDAATQKAVMRFQQAKGLMVDGIVGPQTWAALPAIGGPNPSSPRRSSTNRSTTRTTTNRSTPRATTNRSTPRTTTNRSTPRATTNRSTTRTTTNRSTPRTTTSRSTPTDTTNRSTPRTPVSRLSTPSNRPNSSITEALQKRLKEMGFYQGEIDGIWGPQTQAAVEAAQRSYDVSASDIEKGRL